MNVFFLASFVLVQLTNVAKSSATPSAIDIHPVEIFFSISISAFATVSALTIIAFDGGKINTSSIACWLVALYLSFTFSYSVISLYTAYEGHPLVSSFFNISIAIFSPASLSGSLNAIASS